MSTRKNQDFPQNVRVFWAYETAAGEVALASDAASHFNIPQETITDLLQSTAKQADELAHRMQWFPAETYCEGKTDPSPNALVFHPFCGAANAEAREAKNDPCGNEAGRDSS